MFRFIIRNPQKTRFMSTLSSAKQVNSAQLQIWLAQVKKKTIHNDITIIDVRERHEVEQHGKIKDAINLPFKLSPTMFIAGLSDVNKNAKVRRKIILVI